MKIESNETTTINPTAKFIIREAELTDLFEIRRMKRDGFVEEMEKYHQDPESFVSPKGYARELLYLENKEGCYHNYVVMNDDQIIGGCTITDEGMEHYYVNVMYVSMEHQNEGVGSFLLTYVLNQFPNAKFWHLETPYLSYRNHHFYEKMGFVKVGETEPEEDGFILFQYEKTVS